MYDVTSYPLRDLTACSAALRKMSGGNNLEDAAQTIVVHLYEELRDGRENGRICALARFFVTRQFGRLDPELQSCACRLLGNERPTDQMRCLTLVGTAGMRPEWNDRNASVGHRAIPLASPAMLERSPMISQLVRQFGLEPSTVLGADSSLLVDSEQKSYNVFHVPVARDSPYVPAQAEFVVPYGICSVIGFGGMLPSSNLFAVILFTRIPIPREIADLFRPLALSVKLAILPFEIGL
jgi:two-component system, NtrC family, sensor kinase